MTDMGSMFNWTNGFNQDLSQWCVSKIGAKPDYFDDDTDAWEGGAATRPQWGTCPRGEDGSTPNIDDILPDPYVTEDCHVFIANGNAVGFAIPNGTIPTFVAVDGVRKNYDTEVKGNSFDGSTIHAIFDWDNSDFDLQNFDPQKPEENNVQDWFADILQFGLNSETGQRNQLKSGKSAFSGMTASPKVIADLDISNITEMLGMFAYSKFDVDISGWNTENVLFMDRMFFMSTRFNHNIGNWNVDKVVLIPLILDVDGKPALTLNKPINFDAGAFNWRSPRPPFTERVENEKWFEGFPVTIDGVHRRRRSHDGIC